MHKQTTAQQYVKSRKLHYGGCRALALVSKVNERHVNLVKLVAVTRDVWCEAKRSQTAKHSQLNAIYGSALHLTCKAVRAARGLIEHGGGAGGQGQTFTRLISPSSCRPEAAAQEGSG
jgi:hypothetical protein